MAIIDQVTLRTGVADWLNRSDLTDSQLDDFISIGEAKIYEDLRIPPLEVVQSFTVTAGNSSIIIPAGFIEMIELKLDKADKDDDIILSRVDSKTFSNNRISHAYTRQAGNILLTDENGEQDTGGTYVMTYYKAGDSIGTYSTSVTAGAFVVDKYYKILTVGSTSFTGIGASANTVGVIFKATGVGSGTGTAYVESIPWILGTEFETILYSACSIGSTFLGDVEMEQKFNELTTNKVNSLNQKELRASMKGGSFSAQFSTPLL
jgi:hypothetical protein|tara:strand:- start:249 stop:1037 length:789 start_codon:yes stop_codon:yes gene_type:complete